MYVQYFHMYIYLVLIRDPKYAHPFIVRYIHHAVDNFKLINCLFVNTN